MVAKWPGLPEAQPFQAKKDQVAFRVGQSDIVIALMRAPIPWSDLEGPCQTSWMWKDAESALSGHVGHLIVTVSSQQEPVERSRLLTQVCASILATCQEAPGVFWSNTALLVPSGVFQDFATQILPNELPLHIWLDVRAGPAATGKSSGFTRGLAALGHMEFEAEKTPEPPNELRERFFGLANYVLENGPVTRDGDTIGQDANERIWVVYSKSAFGRAGKVMRLEYSSSGSRKWWFGR